MAFSMVAWLDVETVVRLVVVLAVLQADVWDALMVANLEIDRDIDLVAVTADLMGVVMAARKAFW